MPKFFYLPNQHPLTLETLPDGRFYRKDWSYIVQVPHCCAPVWCAYTGDLTDEGYSWTNQISCKVYETHPLCLTTSDDSFFEGFYEITPIEGLTFCEGEVWCPDTNTKIHIEKTDPMSIWNPFFQRYDPQCVNTWQCKNVKKEMSSSSDCGSYLYFDMFIDCQHLFFDVYCNCGMRDNR
jgi:hypothetical protein